MSLCVKEMFLHCRMGELHLLWQSVHSCASAVSSALQRLLCTCSAWSVARQAFGHPTKGTRWSLLGTMMPTALLALKWCCLHCFGPAVRYSSLLKAKLVSLWFLAHPQTCAHRYLTSISCSWHSTETLMLWWLLTCGGSILLRAWVPDFPVIVWTLCGHVLCRIQTYVDLGGFLVMHCEPSHFQMWSVASLRSQKCM